ncbi:signal peptide containing protein [Theileria equi strain WA]|uniref:Signal peptide containing protein n=1 Tax=Theileria equi strain WA TaxID=1537102 RepID=L1LF01_THEEQ|nr:signal peptide containing protein [Theileria equi strain WA]EKX73810.1 signal peptide containing protein [Theileria equi strain WA]|eukprot:XP_004833262.1 signal peptide containing protein [Theileria equi strain WA]
MIKFIILFNLFLFKTACGDRGSALSPEIIKEIFSIAEDIGEYSESVPDMFGVVKKSLHDLEREIKIRALLPAETQMEAFRMISAPINEFLKQEPRNFFVHSPPRGVAYNLQIKEARDAVRVVYSKLQKLWLASIRK